MSDEFSYHARHREWQREFLRQLIRAAGGNMARAAIMAGLNRTHFYELCRKVGVTGHTKPAGRGNDAWQGLAEARG